MAMSREALREFAQMIGAEVPEDPNAGVLTSDTWPEDPDDSLLAAKLVKARWDEANGYERRMAEQVLPAPQDPDPEAAFNEWVGSATHKNEVVIREPVGRIEGVPTEPGDPLNADGSTPESRTQNERELMQMFGRRQ